MLGSVGSGTSWSTTEWFFFFFSSRRRHTRYWRDWSSDVCSSDLSEDVRRRQRRYGDFSRMNRTWNQSRSETTHERLEANPEEWANYHTLYREARKDWAVVPYEEMIRWCEQRSGYVIGDFGCGEAKLAEARSEERRG